MSAASAPANGLVGAGVSPPPPHAVSTAAATATRLALAVRLARSLNIGSPVEKSAATGTDARNAAACVPCRVGMTASLFALERASDRAHSLQLPDQTMKTISSRIAGTLLVA